MFFVVVLSLVVIGVDARAQWYLTGENFNDQRESSIYEKEVIDAWQFTLNPLLEVNDSHTSFGGALAVYVEHNHTLDAPVQLLIDDLFRSMKNGGCSTETTDVWTFNTFVSVTQKHPLEYEIGLFDRAKNDFIQKAIHQVKLGKEWRIRFMWRCGDYVEEHKVVVVSDILGVMTVTQHIWSDSQHHPLDNIIVDEVHSDTNVDEGYSETTLRVMTYNIWHNNPPEWLIHNRAKRWDWYVRRLRHLADVILDEDPDVLTLQEVRLDNTFASGKAPPRDPSQTVEGDSAADMSLFAAPTGSQLHHVVRHLQQEQLIRAGAQRRETSVNCELVGDGGECLVGGDVEDDSLIWPEGLRDLSSVYEALDAYQIVYQPAMSMYDRNNMRKRIEEGVAILVKSSSLPSSGKIPQIKNKQHISKASALFLPRDFENKYDDHHRVVLHTELNLKPLTNPRTAASPLTLDIMTTHLSLSVPAREKSAAAIWNYVHKNCSGAVQILTGDFNAEPNEASYHFLTGQSPLPVAPVEESDDTSDNDGESEKGAIDSQVGDFVDAWVAGSPLSQDEEKKGYTFPPCNPEKRIDFILVRNATAHEEDRGKAQSESTACVWKVKVADTRITGQNPTADTAHMMNGREGLGMLDKDSPIWASDHYAVVTDLTLQCLP